MDLSLGFPEFSQELAVASKPSLEAVVSRFRSLHQEPDSPVRAIHHQPAAEGSFAEMPAAVDARLRAALEKRGIARLYTHQAEAFEQIAAGRNVVVVTPTASGKTLCYNLPVLNLLLGDAGARAMYLFPTKALAEDQLHEFNRAVEEMGSEIRAFTYDGDTPQDARKAIRQRANVVLTNPDMLHSGILPHHTKWARYFENLRYIVIDELHYYRGVYGSHLANLLRRLRAHLRVLRIRSRSSSAARPPSPIRANWPRRSPASSSNWWSATARRAARSISSSTIRRW